MHKRQHVLVERRGGGIFSTSDGQCVGVRHEPAGGKADASVSDSCNKPSSRLFIHGSMLAEHRYFDTRQNSPFAPSSLLAFAKLDEFSFLLRGTFPYWLSG